jgi:hypothetical protein
VVLGSTVRWPEPVTGVVWVSNEGFEPTKASDITISFFPAAHVLAHLTTPEQQPAGATALLEFSLAGLAPGRHPLRLIEADDNGGNNGLCSAFVALAPSVIVSEYQAAPEIGGTGEWIELYNTLGVEVPVYGLVIGDSTAYSQLPPSYSTIPPYGYLIVCEDSNAFLAEYPEHDGLRVQVRGWRELNNTGDKIRLLGSIGEMVDSLTFGGMVPTRVSVNVESRSEILHCF